MVRQPDQLGPIQAGQQYQNVVNIGAGANWLRLPLSPRLHRRATPTRWPAPLDVPRLCRLGYDALPGVVRGRGPRALRSDAKFPSTAGFSLVLYRPDPAWGFRRARAVLPALPPVLHQAQHEGGHLDALLRHRDGRAGRTSGSSSRRATTTSPSTHARHLELRLCRAVELVAGHAEGGRRTPPRRCLPRKRRPRRARSRPRPR